MFGLQEKTAQENQNVELCSEFRSDSATTRSLVQVLEEVDGMAQFFKALADDTRLKITFSLSKAELCGCDLSVLLDITPAAVSHHLRVLKQLRLVRSRRDGKMVYYSLADDHVETILEQGLAHWKE